MSYDKKLSWVESLPNVLDLDCNELRFNDKENRLLDICKFMACEILNLKDRIEYLEKEQNAD